MYPRGSRSSYYENNRRGSYFNPYYGYNRGRGNFHRGGYYGNSGMMNYQDQQQQYQEQQPYYPPPPSLPQGDLYELKEGTDEFVSVGPVVTPNVVGVAENKNRICDIPGITCVRVEPQVQPDNMPIQPPPGKSIRRRDFCITYWGDHEHMMKVAERIGTTYKTHVAYFIFQKEICSTSLRPHWQCYIEFYDAQYVTFVKDKIFADNTVHVEIRLRPREDCRQYCKKKETRAEGSPQEVGPFEFGVWREVGGTNTKNKLAVLQEAIADGREVHELVHDDPSTVLRYRSNLEWYRTQIQQLDAMKKSRVMNVRVFYGLTGSGKTHLATNEATYYCNGDRSLVYILSGGSQGKVWFDGYRFGKVLVIDDFDSWIPWTLLLRLLDKYPLRLEVKGGTIWAKYEEVWITSNKAPHEWTNMGERVDKRHMDALMRRIHWILYCPAMGKFVVQKQPHPPHRLDLPTVEPLPPPTKEEEKKVQKNDDDKVTKPSGCQASNNTPTEVEELLHEDELFEELEKQDEEEDAEEPAVVDKIS